MRPGDASPATRLSGPPPPLGIQLSSLGPGPPGPLLATAAAAGFSGVGLSSSETAEWVEAGQSYAALRAALQTYGLRADYLDPVILWLGQSEPAFPSVPADRVLEMASALDVPRVNVVIGGDYDEAEAIDAFASVARRITDAGMRPMVEFVPFLAVSSLDRALAVVRGAGVPRAGILLDVWHLLRSGGVPEDLDQVPPGLVQTVHLSDAPTAAPADLLEETMNGRLYPGEGAARAADVVRRVRRHSPDALYTVEVYAPTRVARDPDAFARRCYESARALFREDGGA